MIEYVYLVKIKNATGSFKTELEQNLIEVGTNLIAVPIVLIYCRTICCLTCFLRKRAAKLWNVRYIHIFFFIEHVFIINFDGPVFCQIVPNITLCINSYATRFKNLVEHRIILI